jgi:hypothetical protein
MAQLGPFRFRGDPDRNNHLSILPDLRMKPQALQEEAGELGENFQPGGSRT